MSGKKYNELKKQIPAQSVSITDAVTWLKNNVKGKFDETVEVHVRLGVDASKSDQMVKGSVSLPGGTPKAKRVVVVTSDGKKAAAAKEAGAVEAGSESLIDALMAGKLEADVIVATPDMMPKIAKAAKVLGPKGLMPNPKNGTVTPDVTKAVAELVGGKINFKMDASGNIHESIAKLSWEADKITKNIAALTAAVKAARPSSQKGEYVKSVTVKSTMSPGIAVAL